MIEIIALGWLANIFVHFWISLMAKTKVWVSMKPFACEECMGFWIGLIYALYYNENIIIFAGLSSLSAVTTKAILERLYR